MVLGELWALLTSEMLPDALLVAVGANCRLQVLDCPASIPRRRACDLIVKLCSETVACEMVKLAVPGLVSVIFWVLVVPTTALPKLTLGGVTESWGCTPVPLR